MVLTGTYRNKKKESFCLLKQIRLDLCDDCARINTFCHFVLRKTVSTFLFLLSCTTSEGLLICASAFRVCL